ncbi:hypothetical protein PUMCH_003584 [Australozyma saopauloensis]|uniref:Class E vacuolar protein-sorting machinery protein HSE1 n=1 Tax=Australozyma saopauloensis TaxID=291208 RepID=A0AAX4HEP1_9ASCO|nr:hypothetical protein PUMCH_003584 [[Candida] saopauloensis]
MPQLDILIQKATDATLTSDDWRLIMEVCDAVSAAPEQNTKTAITALKTCLSKKDANTILRTLSLMVALAENCGSRMQQEIASTSFLNEFLIKKLADKKLHKELKIRIADTIGQLHGSFKSDPSLKPISDAYNQVRLRYSQYLTNLPDKPAKQALSSQERNQQDMELDRALKLSVQEYEREQSLRKAYLSEKPLPQAQNREQEVKKKDSGPKSASHASIASVKKVCALYDLISYEADELSFRKGDIITVIESVYRDWWRGSLPNGKTGIFPLNYVTPVISKTAEELAREEELEANLINVENRKIDKLLSLLSSSPDPAAEEEITQLYNQIIPHKATLARLIDSYSSRSDELRVMNDQLSHETKNYNELLDGLVSMRQKAAATGPLPYPSNQALQGYPPTQPSNNDPRLTAQPTSYGFGNNIPLQFGQEGSAPIPNSSYQQQGQVPYPYQTRY